MKSGNISWKCAKKECRALIETDSLKTSILEVKQNHNHLPLSDGEIERDGLRNTCKRKAAENLCIKPSKIRKTTLASAENYNLSEQDIKTVRQAVYEARSKVRPPKPRSRVEALQQARDFDILTNRNEKFCHVYDDIVLLTCATNIEFLFLNSDVILGDGTFYVCPKHFYQLYTIHAYKDEAYFQVIYAFLPDKKETTYTEMWSAIQSLCAGKLCPKQILTDFEIAAINAAKILFPRSIISLCSFHLGQNWYKQICKCGLSTEFQNGSEIGKWLKLFFSVPYLPPSLVPEAFTDLFSNAPVSDKATQFADYVLNTYIKEDCLFPPHLWSGLPSMNCPRTTNGAESFHKHIKSEFYHQNPDIHTVIENLRQGQAMTYLKMKNSTPRKNEDLQSKYFYIIAAFSAYSFSDEINIMWFLNEVKYKCLPAIL